MSEHSTLKGQEASPVIAGTSRTSDPIGRLLGLVSSTLANAESRHEPFNSEVVSQFASLLEPGFATSIINEQLKRMIARPSNFEPAWEANQILLGKDHEVNLALTSVSGSPRMAVSATANCLIGVACGHPLNIAEYQFPGDDPMTYQGGEPLRLVRSSRLCPGESCQLPMNRTSVLSSDVASTIVVLTGPELSSVMWAFETEQMRPIRAFSAKMDSGSLMTMSRLLAVHGSIDDAIAIAGLTNHRDHFVRWAAVRDLLQIAPELGVERLSKMHLDDEHPHIRKAAGSTLAALGLS
jgi:hypothetical protein